MITIITFYSPSRCPPAPQVFDTVEAKIDTVRVLGGALYTAHVAAYLRRLRDRITQVVLRCSGRDPADQRLLPRGFPKITPPSSAEVQMPQIYFCRSLL